MRFSSWTAFACGMLVALNNWGQADSIIVDSLRDTAHVHLSWTRIGQGVDLCITDAPHQSVVNDSKLTVLRINPSEVEFQLLLATELDRKARPVDQWADSFGLNIVFNAGMYDLAKPLISRGLLKNFEHYNQKLLHPTFNSMLALHPKDTAKAGCCILDMGCNPFATVQNDYHSFVQGLRMLDCEGRPMNWKKRVQSCSMLVAAEDDSGNIYLIFSRSPYVHNEFIGFLLKFPFLLKNAIYLEGGPETSLYVNVGETRLQKVGSYVSSSYENDLNDRYWPLPNVIGIKVKP